VIRVGDRVPRVVWTGGFVGPRRRLDASFVVETAAHARRLNAAAARLKARRRRRHTDYSSM
jgi:hypothetical protein